jgi:diguanylate cyclase (GGDEF)-like protein
MISFEDQHLSPSRPAWIADAPSLALAEVIGASLDLTETLRATADALRAVTGADRALIYLHDPVRDTLRQIITTADLLSWDELMTLRGRSVGELPLWYAVRDSASGTLELPDSVGLQALTADRAQQIGMAATLGLALRHPSVASADGSALGIAFCTWEAAQPAFTPEMVRGARSIAAQAAVAIANAHNHAQGEELVHRLSMLASWAARLAAAGSPEQVRSRAARAAGKLLDGPLVAHWSNGGATWYPSPPILGEDHEHELAQLARDGGRFRAMPVSELPAALAAVMAELGLEHSVVSRAVDRGSLLFVARGTPVTGIDEQVACLLADLAGSALRTAEAHARVAHLALTDPLTEVGNRRAFETRVAEAIALSVRTGHPMSLCLVDLDNFRSFNESGGHQAGDEALRLVAAALRAEMRTSDQAFRIGGDEFALVLPETPAANAVSLLHRVLAQLCATHLGPLSITAGIAEAPSYGRDVDVLYNAADQALYDGKHAGRGRVTLARVWDVVG